MTVLVFEKKLPRGKFCVYNHKPDFQFTKVKQTHSNIVLDETHGNDHIADGIVGQSIIPMAILTADCLPILILGENNSHAFLHAGWKGLQNGIIRNDFVKQIKPFYAFIGPHIRQMHYEVQPDFKNEFSDSGAFVEKNGKLYFNLSYVATKQLKEFYPNIEIEDCGNCTFNETIFHSYRRNKTSERNWNIYIP